MKTYTSFIALLLSSSLASCFSSDNQENMPYNTGKMKFSFKQKVLGASVLVGSALIASLVCYLRKSSGKVREDLEGPTGTPVLNQPNLQNGAPFVTFNQGEDRIDQEEYRTEDNEVVNEGPTPFPQEEEGYESGDEGPGADVQNDESATNTSDGLDSIEFQNVQQNEESDGNIQQNHSGKEDDADNQNQDETEEPVDRIIPSDQPNSENSEHVDLDENAPQSVQGVQPLRPVQQLQSQQPQKLNERPVQKNETVTKEEVASIPEPTELNNDRVENQNDQDGLESSNEQQGETPSETKVEPIQHLLTQNPSQRADESAAPRRTNQIVTLSDFHGKCWTKESTQCAMKQVENNSKDLFVLKIPDGVETIMVDAFSQYCNFEQMIFPSSVRSVGTIYQDPFRNCINLNTILVQPDNDGSSNCWLSEVGYIRELWKGGDEERRDGYFVYKRALEITEVTISETVESIPDN